MRAEPADADPTTGSDAVDAPLLAEVAHTAVAALNRASCRRVGVGGLCPHCDEPVAIPDLLEAAETPAELEVITMPGR